MLYGVATIGQYYGEKYNSISRNLYTTPELAEEGRKEVIQEFLDINGEDGWSLMLDSPYTLTRKHGDVVMFDIIEFQVAR